MRIRIATATFVVFAASGCSTTPSTAASDSLKPVEIPVSCTSSQSAVDCLRIASDLCGEKGYDLYDRDGKAIGVADIRDRISTARCRD